MTGFALLWSKTLRSSLWIKGSKETKLVFLTLLMLKNVDGIIQSSVVGLADAAKVTDDEAREALRVLLSPDPNDTSKVEQGRRIREVPGGWQIVNADLYRFSTEAKRLFWAQQKAEQRAAEAARAEMTPEQRKEFDAARKKEYRKRRKGTRAAKREGAMAGAQDAIADGLADARAVNGSNDAPFGPDE